MNTKKILVTPGDGIGPEVSEQAINVLRHVTQSFGINVEIIEKPVGGTAFDLCGTPIPNETLETAKNSDAILLGAVGGPKW